MSPPLIECRELGFSYRSGRDSNSIFDGVSFSVPQGTNLSFVGRSGCGKTTLLRLIAGLVQPTAGSIRVLGEPPRSHWPLQKVAYLTQKPILLPWKTLRENLDLPFAIRPRDHRPDIDGILSELSLINAAHKRPSELSGGMLQRAMLGAALAMEPQLLLLDEPFSALDEITRKEMLQLVLEIRHRRSCDVVMVTHNLDDAIEVSDFIGVVDPATSQVVVHPCKVDGRLVLDKHRLLEMLQ